MRVGHDRGNREFSKKDWIISIFSFGVIGVLGIAGVKLMEYLKPHINLLFRPIVEFLPSIVVEILQIILTVLPFVMAIGVFIAAISLSKVGGMTR